MLSVLIARSLDNVSRLSVGGWAMRQITHANDEPWQMGSMFPLLGGALAVLAQTSWRVVR
eukprot:10771102-Heterocapsa_arctica.AAC.1